MSRKTAISLAFLILSSLVIYSLWPSDERRIKKLLREGAEAIEQEKTEDVMAKVSFNYRGEDGLTYLLIKKGMEHVFRELSAIKIEYEIKDITVKDARAIADLDIRVIASYGKDTGYAVGDAAKPARMRFFLEKERTSWLVNSAEGIPLNF